VVVDCDHFVAVLLEGPMTESVIPRRALADGSETE
jgi:hypothetical protein